MKCSVHNVSISEPASQCTASVRTNITTRHTNSHIRLISGKKVNCVLHSASTLSYLIKTLILLKVSVS
jgi:hypothetical protein